MAEASLVRSLRRLKQSAIAEKIKKRTDSFSRLSKKSGRGIFKELCFCLLTANYSAAGAIAIQKALGNEFLWMPRRELSKELKRRGYRFPNTRASYICEARAHIPSLKRLFDFGDGKSAREWLVKNIKGLGYKEASHFLRNIGFTDVAIIDFHIIDLLARNRIIKKPMLITKKRYIKIEKRLEKLARRTGLTLAELDLYLWYLETGKVLK